jgi:hypothetical protein
MFAPTSNYPPLVSYPLNDFFKAGKFFFKEEEGNLKTDDRTRISN